MNIPDNEDEQKTPRKRKKRKVTTKSTGSNSIWIIFALFAGFISGAIYIDDNPLSPQTKQLLVPSIDNNAIELCFTPPAGCASVIEREIAKAKTRLYIQAYGLTKDSIADAIIAAKKRGVKVRVLLDRSNIGSKYSKLDSLSSAGIDITIDRISGIAHNKIMIIDQQTVITGSFNFTNGADSRNAENVLIINNSKIAEQYLQNWLARKAANQNGKIFRQSSIETDNLNSR